MSITDHDTSNLKYEIKQPYAGKLTAEERHPVFAYQPYHTKVPPDVIKRLIEYYTKPGDLVLDGFSGSGMTGVAARESGRRAILIDLCPIATFTSQVNCVSHHWEITLETMRSIIAESKEKLGFLYYTKEKSQLLEVNYFVWSDVFTCPECIFEFPFFPHGVIHHGNKVETRKSFPCPNCGAELNVRRVERVITHDGKKRALVWVNAGSGRVRINREPTQYDIELLQRVEDLKNNNWFPLDKIDSDGYSAKLAQLGDKAIDNVSRFLSNRNLVIFSDLWNRVHNISDNKIRNLCFSTLTSIYTVISERQGYFGGGGGMSGNLYMPIVRMEKNIYDVLESKLGKLEEADKSKRNLITKVLISINLLPN